jgi:hypothetical protein
LGQALDRFADHRQPVGAQHQDVLHAALPQLAEDAQPELRAFGGDLLLL